MGRTMRVDLDLAVAEVDRLVNRDEMRRRDDIASRRCIAGRATQRLDVVRATLCQGPRQTRTADEFGIISAEGGGAEDVIRADMSQHDVADRPVRQPVARVGKRYAIR